MKVVVFMLVGLLFQIANPVCLSAENWLIKESKSSGMLSIIPIRIGENRNGWDATLGGFEIKNIELFTINQRGVYLPVKDYGFTIREDKSNFIFNKNDIQQFYLHNFNSSFEYGWDKRFYWHCGRGFFHAVLDNQQVANHKNKGVVSYFPTGKLYTKYISVTEVLGKKKIKEKMRPVEVFAFANNRRNAGKAVSFLEQKILDSAYHAFQEKGYKYSSNFSGIANDKVTVDYAFTRGKLDINGQQGKIDIPGRMNSFTTTKLGGRKTILRSHKVGRGNGNNVRYHPSYTLFVQYKGNVDDFYRSNRKKTRLVVPQCQ